MHTAAAAQLLGDETSRIGQPSEQSFLDWSIHLPAKRLLSDARFITVLLLYRTTAQDNTSPSSGYVTGNDLEPGYGHPLKHDHDHDLGHASHSDVVLDFEYAISATVARRYCDSIQLFMSYFQQLLMMSRRRRFYVTWCLACSTVDAWEAWIQLQVQGQSALISAVAGLRTAYVLEHSDASPLLRSEIHVRNFQRASYACMCIYQSKHGVQVVP